MTDPAQGKKGPRVVRVAWDFNGVLDRPDPGKRGTDQYWAYERATYDTARAIGLDLSTQPQDYARTGQPWYGHIINGAAERVLGRRILGGQPGAEQKRISAAFANDHADEFAAAAARWFEDNKRLGHIDAASEFIETGTEITDYLQDVSAAGEPPRWVFDGPEGKAKAFLDFLELAYQTYGVQARRELPPRVDGEAVRRAMADIDARLRAAGVEVVEHHIVSTENEAVIREALVAGDLSAENFTTINAGHVSKTEAYMELSENGAVPIIVFEDQENGIAYALAAAQKGARVRAVFVEGGYHERSMLDLPQESYEYARGLEDLGRATELAAGDLFGQSAGHAVSL